MTGPEENSEFCFPETLSVPQGEAEGTIEVEGKRNSLFPEGPVINFLFYLQLRLNNRKNRAEKNALLDAIAYTGCSHKIECLPKPTCLIEKSR